MRILIVDKYHYFRGGAETQMFALAELLQKHGHEVIHFSMHHPKNLKYKYEKFFVPHIDFFDELKNKTIKSRLKVLKNMFYSIPARKKFREVLDFFQPDIIHIHNIHKHLTISILYEAKKREIPVIWTLHDYTLLCPNYVFLSHNKICERCKNKNYLAPIIERCVKDSFQASFVSAFEKFFNDLLGIDKKVDAYISPSIFLKNKFVEFGFDKKKIYYLPNFHSVSKEKIKKKFSEKYFLYFGRLSCEKGISTLCEAAIKSKINLKIAGEGPLRADLEKEFSSKRISFLGYKQGKDLEKIRKNAWFSVLSSQCYENNPFSIIESFSDGVPSIGSNIGGIPELVRNNVTGYLFVPRSINDLAKKLRMANALNMKKRNKLSINAREFIRTNYDPDQYYQKLMIIYHKLINEKKWENEA